MSESCKITMDLRDALTLVKLAIQNGNFQAAMGLLDDLIAQIPVEKKNEQAAGHE